MGDSIASGRTDIFGPVTITNGNCSYTNDLAINGSLAIEQSFFSENAVIRWTMSVQDQLNVDAVLAVTGNIHSGADLSVGGTLVAGDASVATLTAMDGATVGLTVAGNTTLGGDLTAIGGTATLRESGMTFAILGECLRESRRLERV